MDTTLRKLTTLSGIMLLVIGSGVITGCVTTAKKSPATAQGDEQPTWLLNTPIEQGALYGVGSSEVFGGNEAAALGRAKDFARVELIKQIEVDISGTVSQEISETVKNNTTTFTQNLSQTVSSKVPEFKLSNVMAVDSFNDKKNRHITALVKLDVEKEKRALAQQIASLDQQLVNIAKEIEQTSTKGMSKLRLASPALVMADQRAGLQARFNQLDASQRATPLIPPYIKRLISNIYQMIASLKVSIATEGETVRALQTGLISQLTSKGITISEPGTSDIEVLYSLHTNMVMRDGMAFAFTEGDVWIKDEQGRVVSAFKAKAKGTSVDRNIARTRSIEKLSSQLGDALLNSLFK